MPTRKPHDMTFDDLIRASVGVPLQDETPQPEEKEEPESEEE